MLSVFAKRQSNQVFMCFAGSDFVLILQKVLCVGINCRLAALYMGILSRCLFFMSLAIWECDTTAIIPTWFCLCQGCWGYIWLVQQWAFCRILRFMCTFYCNSLIRGLHLVVRQHSVVHDFYTNIMPSVPCGTRLNWSWTCWRRKRTQWPRWSLLMHLWLQLPSWRKSPAVHFQWKWWWRQPRLSSSSCLNQSMCFFHAICTRSEKGKTIDPSPIYSGQVQTLMMSESELV